MHVIELKLFALTSLLLPREMLFYEPEVFFKGLQIRSPDKHLEVECDIDLH